MEMEMADGRSQGGLSSKARSIRESEWAHTKIFGNDGATEAGGDARSMKSARAGVIGSGYCGFTCYPILTGFLGVIPFGTCDGAGGCQY